MIIEGGAEQFKHRYHERVKDLHPYLSHCCFVILAMESDVRRTCFSDFSQRFVCAHVYILYCFLLLGFLCLTLRHTSLMLTSDKSTTQIDKMSDRERFALMQKQKKEQQERQRQLQQQQLNIQASQQPKPPHPSQNFSISDIERIFQTRKILTAPIASNSITSNIDEQSDVLDNGDVELQEEGELSELDDDEVQDENPNDNPTSTNIAKDKLSSSSSNTETVEHVNKKTKLLDMAEFIETSGRNYVCSQCKQCLEYTRGPVKGVCRTCNCDLIYHLKDEDEDDASDAVEFCEDSEDSDNEDFEMDYSDDD